MAKRNPKIARQGHGTAEWRDGHWYVRDSLPDGTRPRYRLCKPDACDCASMSEGRRENLCELVSTAERACVQGELEKLDADQQVGRLPDPSDPQAMTIAGSAEPQS